MKQKIPNLIIIAILLLSIAMSFLSPVETKAFPILNNQESRSVDFAQEVNVVGDSVIYSDNVVYLEAYPHTLYSSGWVNLKYKLLNYNGTVDIVAGFNDSNLHITESQVFESVNHANYVDTVDNVTFKPDKVLSEESTISKADIGDEQLNSKKTKVTYEKDQKTDNVTIAYSNSENSTYTYKVKNKQLVVSSYDDWNKPIKTKQSANISYAGASKWESIATAKHSSSNTYYMTRVWIDVPFSGTNVISGKYNIGLKPSNLTIEQAKNANQLWIIDPWYSASWTYRKSISLSRASGAVTNFQFPIKVYYGSGTDGTETIAGVTGGKIYTSSHCATDFKDIRFTTSDGSTLLYQYLESKTDSNNAVFWVKFDSIGTGATTFYMYYGNSGATVSSDGNNTFVLFDNFPGAAIDTSKWEHDTASTSVSSNTMSLSVTAGTRILHMKSYYGVNYRVRMYAKDTTSTGDAYLNKGLTNTGFDRTIVWRSAINASSKWLSSCYNGTLTATERVTRDANYHTFDVFRISSSSVKYSVDDGTIYEETTNIPTDDLTPGFYVYSDTGTSQIDCQRIYLMQHLATGPAFGSYGSEETLTYPTVTSSAATSVVMTTATANGNITGLGSDSSCTKEGIVYGTTSQTKPTDGTASNATAYASYTENSGTYSTGTFTVSMSSLGTNTTYYYRTFAKNTKGYSYSTDEQSFTTTGYG
jgi:hypothetical protein